MIVPLGGAEFTNTTSPAGVNNNEGGVINVAEGAKAHLIRRYCALKRPISAGAGESTNATSPAGVNNDERRCEEWEHQV
jgi:hypothetical protein